MQHLLGYVRFLLPGGQADYQSTSAVLRNELPGETLPQFQAAGWPGFWAVNGAAEVAVFKDRGASFGSSVARNRSGRQRFFWDAENFLAGARALDSLQLEESRGS